jgi:hypothetical protein
MRATEELFCLTIFGIAPNDGKLASITLLLLLIPISASGHKRGRWYTSYLKQSIAAA